MDTQRLALLLSLILLSACASPPPPAARASLDEWIAQQEKLSLEHLRANISPTEPKTPAGPAPRKGIVVAALHKKDPDYYFHWVRDSANVMRVMVERGRADDMPDFLELSRDLQRKFSLGEPRFTVTGEKDTLPWSRPQYDGPALRALATMEYLKAKPQDKLAREVLKIDLDFVEKNWRERGFDLWEELKADNYHTRLVQLAALESAGRTKTARLIEKELDRHWDAKRGILRSQLVIERTDGYTKKNTDLDSAVVVAVVESGRVKGGHSVMDDRVHSTVVALEKLFQESFPINADTTLGLAYGRYKDDHYYGGNPWYLVSAGYAQFYYRLAKQLETGPFMVTERNMDFTRAFLPSVQLGPVADREPLRRAFKAKGDAILERIRAHTPEDGQLYEQFDKVTGKPASSRGIGWSHSALIAAFMERATLQ